MASSKPDILLILLQKLMEEGNMLYKVCDGVANLAAFCLNRLQTRCFCGLVVKIFLSPCFSEGTYEGGGPALPVRPEEVTSRGAGRGAEGAQRPAGLPLPKPFPLPQENQCKAHSCIKLLMHYLTPVGLLDAERMARGLARRGRRLLKIYNLSLST